MIGARVKYWIMSLSGVRPEIQLSVPQRALRKAFGPARDPVTRWWRHWWVDLEDFARTVSRFGPFSRAVEIGCADGYLTECLVAEMPEIEVTGIDIQRPGSFYREDPTRATFERITARELASREGGSFELAVLCDVLHHVPTDERVSVLADSLALVAPGGYLVVKEWIEGKNPASIGAWLSDRCIAGDRIKFVADRASFIELLTTACPAATIVAEGRVPPRWNNLYLALRAA